MRRRRSVFRQHVYSDAHSLSIVKIALEDDKTALGEVRDKPGRNGRHILVRVLSRPEILESHFGIERDGQSEFTRI